MILAPNDLSTDAPSSRAGAALSVASAHAGVNSDVLTDETVIDPLSGNAVLNGIPVELAPVRDAAPVPAS